MKVTRVYTGDDGESHFADLELPLADAGEIGRLSEPWQATGIIFRETDEDYNFHWHNAPRRQFVIMLDGAVEIEVGDGEMRRLGPGDILLLEDTIGRGHISRAVEAQPRRSIFVTLE